jgi:hypothetical protein
MVTDAESKLAMGLVELDLQVAQAVTAKLANGLN